MRYFKSNLLGSLLSLDVKETHVETVTVILRKFWGFWDNLIVCFNVPLDVCSEGTFCLERAHFYAYI